MTYFELLHIPVQFLNELHRKPVWAACGDSHSHRADNSGDQNPTKRSV